MRQDTNAPKEHSGWDSGFLFGFVFGLVAASVLSLLVVAAQR